MLKQEILKIYIWLNNNLASRIKLWTGYSTFVSLEYICCSQYLTSMYRRITAIYHMSMNRWMYSSSSALTSCVTSKQPCFIHRGPSHGVLCRHKWSLKAPSRRNSGQFVSIRFERAIATGETPTLDWPTSCSYILIYYLSDARSQNKTYNSKWLLWHINSFNHCMS